MRAIEKMNGPHGPFVRIRFSVNIGDDGETAEATGLAKLILTDRSKLGRWAAAILGREPDEGQKVRIPELLGKPCRITIKHKTHEDGYVIADVVKVEPEVPF